MLNRDDIVRRIAITTGEGTLKVRKILACFEEVLTDAMLAGEIVRLARFGTFYTLHPAPKNIPFKSTTTPGVSQVTPLPTVKFKSSKTLRRKIAERRPPLVEPAREDVEWPGPGGREGV